MASAGPAWALLGLTGAGPLVSQRCCGSQGCHRAAGLAARRDSRAPSTQPRPQVQTTLVLLWTSPRDESPGVCGALALPLAGDVPLRRTPGTGLPRNGEKRLPRCLLNVPASSRACLVSPLLETGRKPSSRAPSSATCDGRTNTRLCQQLDLLGSVRAPQRRGGLLLPLL